MYIKLLQNAVSDEFESHRPQIEARDNSTSHAELRYAVALVRHLGGKEGGVHCSVLCTLCSLLCFDLQPEFPLKHTHTHTHIYVCVLD
jgi:hypothetical protein